MPRSRAAGVHASHPGHGVRGRRLLAGNRALGLIEADAAGEFVRHLAEATPFLVEESGELLNAVTFLLFGAMLLGPALGGPDWRVIVYVVLSLTVVRMLPVALAMVGTGMRRVTVGFLGWFGPRGLASIVFVLLLLAGDHEPETATPDHAEPNWSA